MHFGPAKMALENGFHVVCDKPLCFDMKEAKALQRLVEKTGLIFALTHNYTGYPMVRQMKSMIADGVIGKVHKVDAQYYQGWINTIIHDKKKRSSVWRLDPKKAGISSCMGDIGVHAFNLVEYVSGHKITEVCAQLNIVVEDEGIGIPEDKIFLDYAGFRTLDSVVRAKEIFGQTSITFISQKFHNQRAIYIADHHNIKAVGFNANDVYNRHFREYLARSKASLDLVFNVQPKFLGEKIIIQ